MKEYLYIVDWMIVVLGSITLVMALLLGMFLLIQRFMWWKHKDFMTYRYMRILSKKDSKQFWEFVDIVLIGDKQIQDIGNELLKIKIMLENIEDNHSDTVSRWFNNKNFEFRNVLEEEFRKIRETKK